MGLLPVLAASLEDSATCCTVSWAACTETHPRNSAPGSFSIILENVISECVKKYIFFNPVKPDHLKNITIYGPIVAHFKPLFCTCSVGQSFGSWLARSFQVVEGLLKRGHGSCLCLCSLCPSIWADSSWARLFNTPRLSPTLPTLHVPGGLTQTKLVQSPRSDWHPSNGSILPRTRAHSADFIHCINSQTTGNKKGLNTKLKLQLKKKSL